MTTLPIIGYKHSTSSVPLTPEDVEKILLTEMIYGMPNDTNVEQLFVDRIENERILLFDDGILIREWLWNSKFIRCYFEQIDNIMLHYYQIKRLIDPYNNLPYIPLSKRVMSIQNIANSALVNPNC